MPLLPGPHHVRFAGGLAWVSGEGNSPAWAVDPSQGRAVAVAAIPTVV